MLKLVHSQKSSLQVASDASQAPIQYSASESAKGSLSKLSAQEKLTQERGSPRVNIEEVLRLTGDSAANGDKNDPVVFQGLAESQMRTYIAHYGFNRMPLTFGELQGLMDYCDDLDTITGQFMFDNPAERKLWQSDFGIWRKYRPDMFPAVELYASGNLEALCALHATEDTLTKLGKQFREFN